MILERILLQTIKFDLQVEHPYQYLIKYAKCLKGDKNKLQKMVQMAWTFVNDSLCTTLCLQWEPEIIAVALIHLAGKLSQFEVIDWIGRKSNHLRWWDMFVEDITIDLLEDICHQVLDLYSQQESDVVPDSPPASKIEKQSTPSTAAIINTPEQAVDSTSITAPVGTTIYSTPTVVTAGTATFTANMTNTFPIPVLTTALAPNVANFQQNMQAPYATYMSTHYPYC